jgi:hypothetical protein
VGAGLTEAQKDLAEFWQGKGADAASGGLASLIQATQEDAQNLRTMHSSMADQVAAFLDTKNKLTPMEGDRPDDQGLGDYLSIGASDSEIAAAQWDTNNQANLAHYEQFSTASETNSTNLVQDYTTPSAAPGGPGIDQPRPVGPVTAFGGDPSHPGGSGGHTRAAGMGGPGIYTPPPMAPPVSTPPSGQQVMPPAAQWTPPSEGTRTSGYARPDFSRPPGGYRPPGFGPGSDYNPGGGFGPTGGGFGPIGSGGFGPGAGGSGSGGYGGRMSGGLPGSGSGMREPGMATGSGRGAGMPGEAAGARGGAAAAGAKGAPGMGGMGAGAGAGKGKGGEDEEHQRKITLPEQDPDSIFGGTPDGVKPTPPVIGE